MKYDFDVIVIGAGPAGMAVSIMGTEMGLKVCTIEKRALGGECMNVGCIPSKALLRMAHTRHTPRRNIAMALGEAPQADVMRPFERIHEHLQFITDKKTTSMFAKVDTVMLREGAARFVDPHTVEVGERRITAKRIFVCTGTRPAVPPVPGIDEVDILTNENVFDLEALPRSLTILGGGAIGCEMAQAMSRLGARCTIVHMDRHLIPAGEVESGEILEKVFRAEGIEVYNGRKLQKVERGGEGVVVTTDKGERIESERLLVAAGRLWDFSGLDLDKAGVETRKRGIVVDKYLRTSQKHILAPGDANGHFLLSHAAMHQGMIALMNCMMPWPMKMDFRKFVVPWTVFTDPPVSHVGLLESQVKAKGLKYEVVESKYEDYGAAIAEGVDIGYVRALVSPAGRIHGVRIVGEGSGEMINEWGLAIQKKIRIHNIMMLQHSFPTMSFLTKRVSENWMMNRMQWAPMRRMMKWMF